MNHKIRQIVEWLALKPSNFLLTIAVVAPIIIAGAFYYFLITPPNDFPLQSMYSIEERQTLSQIADEAKRRKVVKSVLVLKVFTVLFSKNGSVISGDYILNKKKMRLRLLSDLRLEIIVFHRLELLFRKG